MKLRLKEILSEQGKTAVWLSREIGVTDVNTRNIVNGVIKPKLDTLEKIASALEVPMWQLFASPEEVNSNTSVCPYCGMPIKLDKGK